MDRRRTFEDFFDMKMNGLQSYLRDAGLIVIGNRRELAQRELAQREFENLDTNKALHFDPPHVNLEMTEVNNTALRKR
jgi:hypothetical protein